jgi:hypothetical protein
LSEQRDGATSETWGSIGEVARRLVKRLLKRAGAEAPAVREETPKEGICPGERRNLWSATRRE